MLQRARPASLAVAAAIGLVAPMMITGSASAAEGADDVPVTEINFDELSIGDESQQPWYFSGAIHGPGDDTGYDSTEVSLRSFSPLAGDTYLGLGEDNGDDGHYQVMHIGEGTVPEVYDEGELAPRIVVSDDGKNAAWVRWEVDDAGEPIRSTVVYANASNGKVQATTEVDAVVEPDEFVNGRVALHHRGTEGNALLWAPGSDPQPWNDVRTVPTSSVESGLTAITTPRTGPDGQPCAAVVDSSQPGNRLWNSCDLVVQQFSPNGKYAIATDTRADGLGASGYTIVEARTGTPVREIRTELTRRVTVEDDGDFVFDARDGSTEDGPEALVRCPVDGDCELTVEPVDFPNKQAWPFLLSDRY